MHWTISAAFWSQINLYLYNFPCTKMHPISCLRRVLQRTSISVNIKERLDFSCALFGPDGGLVSNAPHIPVHLGAMQETVQYQVRYNKKYPYCTLYIWLSILDSQLVSNGIISDIFLFNFINFQYCTGVLLVPQNFI